MNTLTIIAITIMSFSLTATLIFIGVMIERVKWNDLIKKGIIPAPRNK